MEESLEMTSAPVKWYPDCTVNIRGIDEHEIIGTSIGLGGACCETNKGPVILFLSNYALHGKGYTIHLPLQMEAFGCDVNDKSIHVPGGLQHIKFPSGHVVPLVFKDGLPRLPLKPYTDHELETLPHIWGTSEDEWDPSIYDFTYGEDKWYDALQDIEEHPLSSVYDEYVN